MSGAGADAPGGVTPNRAARRAAERRGRKLAALGSSAVLVSGAAGVAMTLTAGPALAAQTFTVDDSSDTGPVAGDCTDVVANNCSLEDAIAAANADATEDLITFSASVTGITLTSDLEGITEPVDIQGPGSGSLTVDGDDDWNVFYFNDVDTGTPSISGLTVTNGNSNGRNIDTSGGAISIYASSAPFSFTDVVVTSSYSENDGAGLWCEGSADATIANSTFTGNEAYSGGGAVYFNCDDLTVTNSTFNKNVADYDSGGGLYFVADNLMITGSTFYMNSTNDDSGGGIGLGGNTHTISGTTISKNTSTSDGGGGAYLESGTLTLTDSQVTGNTTDDYGGGLYLTGGAVTIQRTAIVGNHADNNGGGLEVYDTEDVTVLSSAITGNTADGDGGGIYLSDASTLLTVANTTIAGNTATGYGGGIADNEGDLTLLQTTISGNTATNGLGDGIYFNGYTAPVPVKAGLRAQREAEHKADFAKKVAKGEVKPGDAPPAAPQVHTADAGAVTITGTIVSANVGGEDLETDSDAPIAVTANNSLFGGIGSQINVTGGGNLTGVNNPGLGPLGDNGGPTQTMALLTSSPAIDMGPTTVPSFSLNEFDQRGSGFPRVSNGRVDIGAFELQLVVRFTG